jgi:thiamine-monophosphate kinase
VLLTLHALIDWYLERLDRPKGHVVVCGPEAGARDGDVVAACGRLGWSAAGFHVLSRGFRSPRVLVEAHRRPDVPYDAGIEAAELGATAMCDVSDGLLADAGHIASASGVSIDIDAEAFDIPAQLRDTARALGAEAMDWILTGAEDHALLATFPASVSLPARWLRIGTVTAGSGVTVGGKEHEGAHGHDHFG